MVLVEMFVIQIGIGSLGAPLDVVNLICVTQLASVELMKNALLKGMKINVSPGNLKGCFQKKVVKSVLRNIPVVSFPYVVGEHLKKIANIVIIFVPPCIIRFEHYLKQILINKLLQLLYNA